jgi:hypothetical protein
VVLTASPTLPTAYPAAKPVIPQADRLVYIEAPEPTQAGTEVHKAGKEGVRISGGHCCCESNQPRCKLTVARDEDRDNEAVHGDN